ncbi:MAG: hypothetical protein H6569_13075 [Lewinellaceae bacterium]|nr:hypothetical protein [Lewinellaceae bacterium]
MIKELNDLLHFVKTSVWRDEQLLTFFANTDPELLHLYQTVWKNNLASDAEAARTADLGLTTYKKQARSLRKLLRQMSIFFDEEKAKVDATVKNYVEGTLELALMNLLHMRGYRHAPLGIAKRLYRRGIDYDVPGFAAEALRVLKESVISVGGSARQFDAYSAEYWTCRAYAEAEERAADCFQRLKLPHLQHKAPQGDFQAQTRQCLQALEPFKGKTPSYLFHVYFYIIRGNYLLETANFNAALDNFNEAIRYFQSKRYPVGNSLAMFYYAKVPACIGLRQYAEGEQAVLASLDHAPNGSHNFFNANEMYFYLAMHAGKYAQALELYQTTTRHRRFSNLRPPQRETWHILGAYLFILYQLKGWTPPENSLPVFRSFRFNNETPVYGQDKTGMNVAIQIAFTLLLLLEGRKGDVLERIEALEKYRSRYLHHPGAGRSNLFIRILLQLPKSNFQTPVFRQKIEPLLQELSAAPHRPANQQYELEIIPYETLTGLLLEFLVRGKG